MGVDEVVVVRKEREICISIYRCRDYGKTQDGACTFLAKRFPGRDIYLMLGPKVGRRCCNTFIRPADERRFYSGSVFATKSRLGLSRL
jgi:hypothetical protein